MKYEKCINKLYNFEKCKIETGAICKEPYCKYAVMHLESGKTVYFTCGRKENENASK